MRERVEGGGGRVGEGGWVEEGKFSAVVVVVRILSPGA